MIDRVLVSAVLAAAKAAGTVYWYAWRRWRPQPERDALVYRLAWRRPPCGGPFCDGCEECRARRRPSAGPSSVTPAGPSS